tara:strand:+ start:13102 stop:13263 length:162 start_codon:yes stop_codon:yes gene_type:complete
MTRSEDEERTEKHEQISDLADKFLDQALRAGDPFSEALTNWAIAKAEREIGSV